MIRTATYDIKPGSGLYDYLLRCCQLTQNLSNAITFRIRQLLCGLKKQNPTPNEMEVIEELRQALPEMNRRRHSAWERAMKRWEAKPADQRGKKPERPSPYQMPDKDHSFVGYSFLASWLLVSENPDFLAPGLSRQSAQQAVKRVSRNFKSFFAANKDYKDRPEAYSGRPKIPGYKKTDFGVTCVFSNQDCTRKGEYLQFPKTKERLALGDWFSVGYKIREVRVVPHNNKCTIHVVYDTGKEVPALKTEEPMRVMAIDLGGVNFATTASNGWMPAIVAKGGYIKAENQYFNKRRGYLVGRITRETGDKHPRSRRLERLSSRRSGFMRSEMGRIANGIVELCDKWDIDTIVVGRNKGQKQSINLGHKNNQAFVPIPHDLFRRLLAYKCEEHAIRYLECEESYTSKASFIDNDEMPTYGDESFHHFSGKRSPRGRYQSSDGTRVNADVNGAANIGRKALPQCFQDLSKEPFSCGTWRLFGPPTKTGK